MLQRVVAALEVVQVDEQVPFPVAHFAVALGPQHPPIQVQGLGAGMQGDLVLRHPAQRAGGAQAALRQFDLLQPALVVGDVDRDQVAAVGLAAGIELRPQLDLPSSAGGRGARSSGAKVEKIRGNKLAPAAVPINPLTRCACQGCMAAAERLKPPPLPMFRPAELITSEPPT